MFRTVTMVLAVATGARAFRAFSAVSSKFSSSALAAISTSTSGEAGTDTFRINFEDGGKKISAWHDIPLKCGDNYNFINEIPKYTKAKMEVSTKEGSNPIAQDIKKGKLRDYHGPIFWNYGCLPQTWEDPNVEHPVVKCFGDNDPLDVVEIGSAALVSGSVTEVKVLGVLAMIDDGELDWKLIAINVADPMAAQLHDIGDVDVKMPGVVSGIREWFRWYKTPDDKPLNAFGFDEKALDKKMAEEVIHETHGFWKDLVAGKTDKGKLWLN
jgi:inorganic pyrophosphatase